MEKKQKPAPIVLTTANTGVSDILDELVNDMLEKCNLELNPPKLKDPDGK